MLSRRTYPNELKKLTLHNIKIMYEINYMLNKFSVQNQINLIILIFELLSIQLQ